MIRSALVPKDRPGETYFRWRGGDVSRLEGLTDGVFALALTLILLSMEVPREAALVVGLLERIPAFAATFAILGMTWWYHFVFHRRFGLEDLTTCVLNLLLLFVLLVYVFPLRYLFGALFRESGFEPVGGGDTAALMAFYGGGYALVFLLFTLLHLHAWRQRAELELDAIEEVVTRGALHAHLLHLAVGATSFAMALVAVLGGPQALVPLSGVVFFAIGPTQAVNGIHWSRRAERLLRERGS